VVDERSRDEMRRILKEIQSGKFAREWIRESESGGRNFQRLLKADLKRPIEKVGAKLRARMPWLEGPR
jgi:ketol-acid reductoisomerase